MIPIQYALRRRMMAETGPKTVIITFVGEKKTNYLLIYYNGEPWNLPFYGESIHEGKVGDVIQFIGVRTSEYSNGVWVNGTKVTSETPFNYSYKVTRNVRIESFPDSFANEVIITEE